MQESKQANYWLLESTFAYFNNSQQNNTKLTSSKPNLALNTSKQRKTQQIKHNLLNCLTTTLTILTTLASYSNATSDISCGVNRFNNESPLTERIVGGNNSLQ